MLKTFEAGEAGVKVLAYSFTSRCFFDPNQAGLFLAIQKDQPSRYTRRILFPSATLSIMHYAPPGMDSDGTCRV